MLNDKALITLRQILRILVEGGNNTSEFLSLASQHTKLEVPSYEEIVDLYKLTILEIGERGRS